MLEDKNLDMDMLQRLSEITNTRKEKVFAKTVSLKNFVSKYAKDSGYVMTNNRNASYGNDYGLFEKFFSNTKHVVEEDESYKKLFETQDNIGAYVADPNQNTNKNGIELNGKKSMFLFENVFDEDYSSLYPSIIRSYNLDKNTQVGKYYLIDQHIKEKLVLDFDYKDLMPLSNNAEGGTEIDSSDDLGPTLVDSLMSFDFVRIGEKYFDLPSTKELIDEIEAKIEKKES